MISAKVAPWKRDRVGELAEIINSDGVVGIVDIGGVPAGNMLNMRSDLRGKLTMTMAKKTLIKLAWEQSGRSLDELDTLFDNAAQPAIVHSNALNSFELFSELEKTRQGRAARKANSHLWTSLSRKDRPHSDPVQLLESSTLLEFLQKLTKEWSQFRKLLPL